MLLLETTAKKIAMGKKLLLSLTAVALLALAFTSCKKDISEEELLKNQLAQADSLLKRGGVIKYTVKVVSAANSSFLKAKMSLENAIVTVYQNDKVYNATTDANGFAIFTDMRVGTISVNVKLKDHAEVDYVADITPQENLTNLSQTQIVNTIRYASTMVPMFPIADPGCATITGKVTAELDLTNTTPEAAEGVKVTATVDVDDPDFVARYIAPTQGTSTSPSAGRILKYAFNDATVTATTAADGTYTLKVPASINGLPIKLSIADYHTTQKIYLEKNPETGEFKPGEYTIPVEFSSYLEPSIIPEVKPLYLNIEEPNCPYGKIIQYASFSYQVDQNGTIIQVSVINKGIYTSKPAVIIIGNGNGAILDPVFNSITGEIETVNIINGGIGYKVDQVTGIRAYLSQELRKPEMDFVINKDGYLSQITMNDYGKGYVTSPKFEINSAMKDINLPILKMNLNYSKQELSNPTILDPGKGIKTILNFPVKPITGKLTSEMNITSGQLFVQNHYLGTGNR